LLTTVDHSSPESVPTAEELELAAIAADVDLGDLEPDPDDTSLIAEAKKRRRSVLLARKIGIAIGGGLILAAGLAMIPLPGPGWLVVVLGLWVLSLEFAWAQRMLDPIQDRVIAGAHAAASNAWGTALSVLSGLGVIAAGIVWATWDTLPLSSWFTGGSVAASGVLALITIAWSVQDLKKKRARETAD
jgi:uncharacterized protein (TIGR02611 family)